MTSEQQQEFNKGFLRVFCRGPLKIHQDRLRAINAKRHRLLDDRDFKGLKELTIALNAILDAGEVPPAEDTYAGWNLALIRLMDLRIPCGQDISDLIGAPPYDGERHTIVCTACGTEHLYRAALCDEEAAKKATAFQSSLDALVD